MRRNPFYVTPKGTAHFATEAEMRQYRAQRTIPRAVERDAVLEVHSGTPLPPGYEVRVEMLGGSRIYGVFYMGVDTGKYGTSEDKAKEIISRMKDGKVVAQAERFRDMGKKNPRAQQARKNFVGTSAVVALSVAPFVAKMVNQLVSARADEWRELGSYQQKVAYLKTAFPKDSSPQEILRHKDQTERLVAYIDHLVGSGALDTAGEGAAAGIESMTSLPMSRRNPAIGRAITDMLTEEQIKQILATPPVKDVDEEQSENEYFEFGQGKFKTTCPYSGKSMFRMPIARPRWEDEAPWGLRSAVIKAADDEIQHAIRKVRAEKEALARGGREAVRELRESRRLEAAVTKATDLAGRRASSTSGVNRYGFPAPGRFNAQDRMAFQSPLTTNVSVVEASKPGVGPYTQVDVLRILDRADSKADKFILNFFKRMMERQVLGEREHGRAAYLNQEGFSQADAPRATALERAIVKHQAAHPTEPLPAEMHAAIASLLVRYLEQLTEIANAGFMTNRKKVVTNPR